MEWINAAISNIENQRISHRNWNLALSDGFSSLHAASAGEVVSLTGPSRVGRSRIADELIRMLVGDASSIAEGVLPVIKICASNCSVKGAFSTKDFTFRALKAMEHPFYGIGRRDDPWGIDLLNLMNKTPESVFRHALETGLVYRKSKFIFIDEAHHVRYVQGGEPAAAAILDSWKCLAEETKVVLVLVGAYPMLRVLRLSPHLLGRKGQVHFPRYHAVKEDLVAFEQILTVYDEYIRVPHEVGSLRSWNELLYEGSLGCLGHLGKWLREALALARSRGDEVLSEKHLVAMRKPTAELRAIAAEIIQGEEDLKSFMEDHGQPDKSKLNGEPKRKTRSSKPFQKNPRRHKLGGRA
ncbi:MAG: AAA family ATPase [Candidatus Thiodiazotropha endolucinida]